MQKEPGRGLVDRSQTFFRGYTGVIMNKQERIKQLYLGSNSGDEQYDFIEDIAHLFDKNGVFLGPSQEKTLLTPERYSDNGQHGQKHLWQAEGGISKR